MLGIKKCWFWAISKQFKFLYFQALKYKSMVDSKSHSRYKKMLILDTWTDKIPSYSSWNIKSMVDLKPHSRYEKMLILGYFETDEIRSSSSWYIKSMVDSKPYSRYIKKGILGYFETDKIRSSSSRYVKYKIKVWFEVSFARYKKMACLSFFKTVKDQIRKKN